MSSRDEPPPPGRKWTAIGVATLASFASFWTLLTVVVEVVGDEDVEPAGADVVWSLGVSGTVLLAATVAALAFISRHREPWIVTMQGVGLVLLVGFVLGVTLRDFATPFAAAVGAGGVVALRREAVHAVRTRVVAVGLAALWVLVLIIVAFPLGVLVAPFLPLPAVGLADRRSERRAAAGGAGAPA